MSINQFKDLLCHRESQGLLRTLVAQGPATDIEIERNGKRLLNFASNDYLGLSRNNFISDAAHEAALKWGFGGRSSRLITGSTKLHEEVEEELAAFLSKESALLFSTGFQANATILPALATSDSTLFIDREIHRSLLIGAQLSGAKVRRYRHGDLDHLERLLRQEARQGSRWIVTESLFSTDGYVEQLQAIVDLARRFGARLLVDDAHAFGVLGRAGRGLASEVDGVDVLVGTFGKAAGVFGAYVALSSEMRDLLINFCSGFIYTTAMPPPVVGAIQMSLKLLPQMDAARAHLLAISTSLRQRASHIESAKAVHHVIPLQVGSAQRALHLSAFLEERGVCALTLRPPSVPAGKAMVRLGLTALHSFDHIEHLAEALRDWNG